ncbi:hypothetical protein NP590_08760 [Methylomonas sp. SURF-2]|uniref:Uncharacterized protein n=1 Tax=Methylomonas subterranea TaxID=2952225 RepID=A0ABT1TG06_9GAMM|nr:hypothetical protein [Methylomonas sp. SURF-2]MCQ8104193.1 hypothetical protein [Methylomonas sp. SURF-2]
MYELSLLFFQIAIFQKGPQDVPASPLVLRLLLPVYVAINYLILFLNGTQATALLQIGVDFGLIVLFCWPLLYSSGKIARFPQTLAAMVGTSVVLSFFALPAIATLNANANDLAYFAMLALVLWHWLVSGHIMRHALDQSLFFGLGLALLYIMLSSQIMAALFPELTGSTQ